jgi:hypothetical protein
MLEEKISKVRRPTIDLRVHKSMQYDEQIETAENRTHSELSMTENASTLSEEVLRKKLLSPA